MNKSLQAKILFENGMKTILEVTSAAVSLGEAKLEFEKAGEFKSLIEAIEKTTERQQVVFNDNKDRDIVNLLAYDNYVTINILFMRQGRLLFSKSKIFSYFMNPEEILFKYLVEFYENNIIPQEIILLTIPFALSPIWAAHALFFITSAAAV